MSELVSIVIPAYNAERYIEKSIKSCINQTYKNIEIIVVNDGSTDNTVKIAQTISRQDNRIKIISTENGGVSKARNIGILNSTGEYLTFLDADDQFSFTALDDMMKIMLTEKADIVSAKMFNSKTEDFTDFPRGSKQIEIWEGMDGFLKSLEDHPDTYSSVAKIYKKSFLKDVCFPENFRIHEDSYFIFELLTLQPKVVVFDEYVYKVYLSPNSASRSRFSDKYFDILRLAEKKAELIKSKFPDLEEKTYNLKIKANMALLINLCKTYEKKYRYQEKQVIKEIIQFKKYFKSAKENDIKWFKIITLHLYPLYKLYYCLRYMRKNEDK